MTLTRIIAVVMAAASLAHGAASPVQAESAGAYLAARQAGYDNNFAAAAEYYVQALTRDLNNPGLMEAAVVSTLGLGDVARSETIATRFSDKGFEGQVPQMVLLATAAQRFTPIWKKRAFYPATPALPPPPKPPRRFWRVGLAAFW